MTINGQRLLSRVDETKGDPSNALTKQEAKAKAMRLAQFRGGAIGDEIRGWIELIWKLDTVENWVNTFPELQ
ncbi:hypothetical protein [Aquamicrobium soli]|uniref:Uncharacterized protein n=1 Tax=Aquamicrobium soli TaxID=1811518 RepID=A0ABV7K7Y5_9HYPH